mgnify:CR=1 FL=1
MKKMTLLAKNNLEFDKYYLLIGNEESINKINEK